MKTLVRWPAALSALLIALWFGPLHAASVSGSRTTNVNIPDGGDWVYSRIVISEAPAGALVTSVEVSFRVVHPYSGDVLVDLDVATYTNTLRLWNREGGSADNPSRTVVTSAFNGLPVNNEWFLYARDMEPLDSGYIDEWTITLHYQSTNAPPNSFSKLSPSNSAGVTSYSVNFDWANASDPDGDSVTYNLVVNDDTGNSVSGCSANGISSSARSCTLPAQPNEDYFWQVWAVDSNGNAREASGGFWHLWTDTAVSNQPPNAFSKVSPSNGQGVTSYSVTFDWASASDPDGDAVTYNLVVNNDAGSSVAGCSAQGLASSMRTCTLPQQPNEDYYWQAWAVDSQGNTREASGGFWHVWTDTAVSNQPPNAFSKSTPSNGEGVTNYSVTFDWASASDPDGDAVTYNLVVNDASGNSVSGCSASALTASMRSCTLPQGPGQDYFWQVTAVDSQGNERAASGGFWHLWTNTGTGGEPLDTRMLWRNAVRADNARITQLFGERYVSPESGNIWTHTGTDISTNTSAGESCGETPIYPVLPGTVKRVYVNGVEDGAFVGNAIMIEHGPNLFSLYAHMHTASARPVGTSVGPNDVLGTIGKSATEECHLHLEVRDFGTTFHPDAEVQNIYMPGDSRRSEFLLEHWIDPVSPSVGQFDPAGHKPSGFVSSAHVPGWDISSSGPQSIGYSVMFAGAYPLYRSWLEAEGKNLGVPHDNGGGAYVHCWSAPGPNPGCANGVWIQDLKRSRPTYQMFPDGHSSLVLNVGLGEVFLLKEGFWNFYVSHDGFQNLGAPSSEEETFTGSPNFDNDAVVQQFEHGALYYHPNAAFDRTPPSSDRITVLASDMTTPVAGTQAWHIVGAAGESFAVHQNGNLVCHTPCTEVLGVDGWRYTLTTPDVRIDQVWSSQVATRVSKQGADPGPLGDPGATLDDDHNFSFNALPSGGVITLQLNPAFFSSGFEESGD